MSVSQSPLQAPVWELAGLALLAVVYFVGYSPTDPATTDALNLYGPVVLVLLLGGSALRMVLLDPNAIWTTLFWFRTATAVYFGFGNLVPIFADEATVTSMQSFYPFGADDLANLNEINAVACLVVLCAANLLAVLLSSDGVDRAVSQQEKSAEERQLFIVGMIFLVVGGSIKYLFVVPHAFGLLSFVLPDSLTTIANFTYAGIYLLTVWSLEYRRAALPLIALFAVVDVIEGFLELQKYAVLITLLLFALAFLRSKVTLLKLSIVVGSLLVTYSVLAPAIEIGRAQAYVQYGVVEKFGFWPRIAIAWNALTLTQSYIEDDSPTKVNALSRLSYSNQSTYAVQQYDNHLPGHSLDNIFAVFVPRILWPDKPIITQIAADFNYAITGNPLSQTSPGLFADAYWDYGWTGVVVAMFLLGLLYGWLSRYTLNVLHKGQWVYFPIVLLAMRLGFRPDGYLVPDMVGGSVILFAALIILRSIVEFPYQILLGQGTASRLGSPSPAAGVE